MRWRRIVDAVIKPLWPVVILGALALVLASAQGGCGRGSGFEDCEPLESRSCECAGGGEGTQTCTPGRTWGDCLDCPRSPRILGLAVGSRHMCGWLEDGTVVCSGDNNHGQLGIGSYEERSGPVTVPGLTDVVSLAATKWDTTCALIADGTVRCWGSAVRGILGDGLLEHEPCVGSSTGCSRVPVEVADLSGVVSIGMAELFVCALLEDRTVWCWGDNWHCQLATGVCPMLPCDSDSGSCSYSPVPMPVLGVTDAVALSVIGRKAMVVHADGAVSWWGEDGELAQPLAQPLEGVTDAVDIASGWEHTCAILRDRTLQCWGRNDYGQLGDGTRAADGSALPPQAVPGIAGVASVIVGESYTCVMLDTGEPRCWGVPVRRSLADNGTYDPVLVPTPVWGLTRVTSLLAGGNLFTCATLPAGSVACWGAYYPISNALDPLGPYSPEWYDVPYAFDL